MAWLSPAPLPVFGSLLEPADYGVGDPAPLPIFATIFTVIVGKTLSADTGAFAFTGKPATLRVGHKLAAATGTFDLTGQDADFAVDTGSAGMGDPAPLPVFGSLFPQPAGTYVLYAWTPGQFTLTGVAADLLRGHALICEPGAFVLTGAPSYSDREMSAAGAAFTLTGIDATLTRVSPGIAAEPGAFTVTGRDAVLIYEKPGVERSMYCAPGAFMLTGIEASFGVREYRLVAGAGDFRLDGQPARLTGPLWTPIEPPSPPPPMPPSIWTNVPRGSTTWVRV